MPQRGMLARFYDLEHDRFTDDLEFYIELARRTGGPVFEIGCGTGRVACALACAGYPTFGLDRDVAMLQRARQRVARVAPQAPVWLFQADMRAFALRMRFPLILVPLNTFAYLLDVQDQIRTLGLIRQHLAPEGLLVLDLPNPSAYLLEAPTTTLHRVLQDEECGCTIMKWVSAQTDLAAQRHDLDIFYDEVDSQGIVRRSMLRLSLHLFFPYEIVHLLERTGFVLEALYGSYELDPYTDQSETMLVLARRARA